MLSAEHITVKYGSETVLEEVSLSVTPGQLTAIVGPNGAGKTTLLRVLNGMVEPLSGKAILDSKPLSSFARRTVAQRITTVAQENETRFPISVLEFVLAGRFAHGGVFGWESGEDLEIAESCLETCGLSDFEYRMMNELSGGERQRVLLARAFATGAEYMLLDEPTNNLDLANQASMLRILKQKCLSGSFSTVVVTHDLNLVTEFADRVLLIDGGRVYADGTPHEVLNESNVSKVFGLKVILDTNPSSGRLRITPVFE